jgi:ABC-2 type transport system ATP-binding protein
VLNTEPAIVATGLRKSYGPHLVLDSIDLTVPQGTVFALLGPNGAGKTTVVRILSTLLKPDAGRIRVAGHDLAEAPEAVRAAIGVTGQFSAVDDLLTGQENLRLMADLLHLPRARRHRTVLDLLERFGLADVAGKPAAVYSGGLRRRLDLAMTMVGAPRVVFLDEPTTGLDPRSRRALWQTVQDLVRDEGVTVFLTTQYLEDAERLADRVALLSRGTLVAEGTPDELKRLVPGGHITVRFAAAASAAAAAADADVAADADELTVPISEAGVVSTLKDVLDRLAGRAADVAGLTVHTPDLDDVFLALTNDTSAATAPTKEPAR